MADQWIAAEKARSLLAQALGEHQFRFVICSRAHAGLVRAKARLVIVGEQRSENVDLPSRFWWAGGHQALDQNWDAGDFATLVDHRHWKAFGVTFAFDDLLEMLPSEQRAEAMHRSSVAASPEWLSAQQARKFAYEKAGINPALAGNAIIEQCRLGFISARAIQMHCTKGAAPSGQSIDEKEWDVPTWFWENFTADGSSNQDWARGIFSGQGNTPFGRRSITLRGVYFLKNSLDLLNPSELLAEAAAETQSAGAGRYPAAWWDDLWCGVWGQIYRGDLQPKTQADVKRAMLDWASNNGHDVSESTIKERARKLFAALNDEGRNSSTVDF